MPKPSKLAKLAAVQNTTRSNPIRLWRRRRPSAGNAALLLFSFLLCAGPALAQGGSSPGAATLTYTKVLKGSAPEYQKITVDADGAGSYDGRKLSEPPSPRSFQLSPPVTQRLFRLAAELRDFRNIHLESNRRVADLGHKTFQYQNGAEVYQCEFNYSTNHDAEQLTDLFEEIGAVERHIAALDYAMRYDHLGLPRELTLIQIDLDNKALADPQLMVSTLKAIAGNPRFLHLAQVRAQDILHQIQREN